jgi:hypothetical protein
MRDEIELLQEARPHAAGPSPELARQARASLMAEIAVTRRPRRWHRRRMLGLAAPAFVAAVAAFVIGMTLSGRNGEQAWAAALVRVAEAAPRLLVDEPGWQVTRADQLSVDYGEMTLADGDRELELKWLSASQYAHAVETRVEEMDDLATAPAADAEARLFRYPGKNEYVAVWRRGDYTVEARGLAPDADAFRALLGSLHEVDVDTWLSAMPASVVKPASQAEVVDEMLAGIPLPPGFDATAIPTTDAVRERYQLGAQVAGAVACAWIDRWVAARGAGDETGAREAVDAMATARTWPVLLEMDEDGAYSEVLWKYAAAMATNGPVPAGKPGVTVEQSYQAALGCPRS